MRQIAPSLLFQLQLNQAVVAAGKATNRLGEMVRALSGVRSEDIGEMRV